MKKTNLLFVVLFTTSLLFVSCSKTETIEELAEMEAGTRKSGSTDVLDETIVLGEKLQDPYDMKNMLTAYQELKSLKADCPLIELKPTHNYLRFLPKTDKEWDILREDTNLIFYDYPLDYEIKNEGTFYHDPSLPDSTYTFQYAVIPIGDKIPDL